MPVYILIINLRLRQEENNSHSRMSSPQASGRDVASRNFSSSRVLVDDNNAAKEPSLPSTSSRIQLLDEPPAGTVENDSSFTRSVRKQRDNVQPLSVLNGASSKSPDIAGLLFLANIIENHRSAKVEVAEDNHRPCIGESQKTEVVVEAGNGLLYLANSIVTYLAADLASPTAEEEPAKVGAADKRTCNGESQKPEAGVDGKDLQFSVNSSDTNPPIDLASETAGYAVADPQTVDNRSCIEESLKFYIEEKDLLFLADTINVLPIDYIYERLGEAEEEPETADNHRIIGAEPSARISAQMRQNDHQSANGVSDDSPGIDGHEQNQQIN